MRALIYAPPDDAGRWRRVCAEHCTRRGYRIVAVTASAEAVQTYLDDQAVEVVVVGHDDHRRLLRLVVPRVETVSEQRPSGRRTRRRV